VQALLSIGRSPSSNHRQTSRSWASNGTRCRRQLPSPSQGGRPPFSSQDPLQLDIPVLSPNYGADRSHRSLLQSSPSSSSQRQVAANKSELGVLFGVGSSEDSDTQGPQLDHQSLPTPVLRPFVASASRSLRSRGPDGRFQNRLRHLVPGVPPPRPLGQHNCSSPYQCFGDYCYVDLSGTQHPLEGRQHHSLGFCQERRGTCSPQVLEVA
jgi:hypothetical protein